MTHIEQRYGDATEWFSQNPVLHIGEAGHESDTGRWKLGDGVTVWNDLPYKAGVDSVGGKTGAVDLDIDDVAGAAPLDAPVFTGAPTAPTPVTSSNSTRLATTAYVKAQGYATVDSPEFTGNPRVPTPTSADDDTSIANTAWVRDLILDVAHPIGDIKITRNPANPATYLGGTWVAEGAGRVLVGIDAGGDAAFDTVGETGGVKEVTLTAAQSGLPQHFHTVPAGAISGSLDTADGPMRSNGTKDSNFKTGGVSTSSVYGSGAAGAQAASSPHTNLQPYLVVYMWRRTA